MLKVVGQVICMICALAGVACWFACVFYGFRAVALRKPGAPLFPSLWESPFNVLFRPSQLTEGGLRARDWCLLAALGFVLSWGTAVLVTIATG